MGVQVPSWDGRLIDLEKAASSKDYCDEFTGVARDNGVEVTELSTHLQGQLVAVHPPMTRPSTGLRRRKCAAIRRRGRNGRSSR
jgi:sugar phosphate isomerase/epimerase